MLRRLALFALFLAPALAYGQAWTLAPGEVYLKLTQGLASASERYDAEGEVVPYDLDTEGSPYRDRSFYLYGEVGLAERLSLFGTIPYKRLTIRDGGFDEEVQREASDLGSAVLGLRVGLNEAVGLGDQSALAANFAFVIPLGYRRNFAPAVGPGQLDLQGIVAYGHSFWPRPAYAQVGLGYRYRTGVFGLSRVVDCPDFQPDDIEELCVTDGGAEVNYSDELLANAEIGYTLFDRVLLQALFDVVWSVDAPEIIESELNEPDVQPEAFPQQRFIRTGLGGTFYISGSTGLSVQAFTAPYARNALRAVELFIGLETRF